MEEMPSLNMPVQRLKVAILPLDLPCSGPLTHSGEILTPWQVSRKEAGQIFFKRRYGSNSEFNPLNAKLNPICHLLVLLGAHHILHVSRVRVKWLYIIWANKLHNQWPTVPQTPTEQHRDIPFEWRWLKLAQMFVGNTKQNFKIGTDVCWQYKTKFCL
jgi:hypothetical protein